MLDIILNTVFSLPYLGIGITIAAILDTIIHFTKVTTRFTLLQIWGCTMFWPIVLVVLCIGYALGKED